MIQILKRQSCETLAQKEGMKEKEDRKEESRTGKRDSPSQLPVPGVSGFAASLSALCLHLHLALPVSPCLSSLPKHTTFEVGMSELCDI